MPRPDEEAESVAVVLADAFEMGKHLGPLVAGNNSSDELEQTQAEEAALPWSLMRVCNIPMLILTLDALQSAKMDKTASITEGDVLREADALELKHNFLLIRVGYLGNLDLAKLLRDFAAKRKQDSNLVLDSVLMPSSTSTTFSESPTYAITPTTRLAHFQPPSDSAKRIKIPREIVEEGLLHAGGLTIRSDLHSIGVDVCSPDVCPLFSENFDWMNLRTHFTVGVLTSDLLGKTISCSIVGEHPTVNAGFGRFVESAIYVQDGQTLLEANLSFLRRRFYPLSPDEYLPAPHERYQSRGKVYLGRKVEMARTSSLSLSLVDANSSLKSNSSIDHSCVGMKCILGQRSRIRNSVLGHSCFVEEDCVVEDCIIGDNVKIGKGTLLKNCLVGSKVVLGSGSAVQDGRLSFEQWKGEEEDQEESSSEEEEESEDGREGGGSEGQSNAITTSAASSEMLGEGSKAYFWPESESSQDSDSEAEELADQLEQTHINDDNDDSCSSLSISRSDSMDSLSSLDSDVSIDLDKPLNARDSSAFDNELRQSLERAFTEGHPIDNLVIELKTMRMSSNVPISDVRNGFLHYLLSQVPLATSPDVPMKERDVVIGPLVKRWGGVVTTLAPLDEADMVEVMLTLQRLHAPTTSRDFPIWLKHFYQEDVISEEAVLEWWKDSESRRDEGLKAVRQAAAPFVKAVLESGSDDSDEDDSEESEEDHE